jgi:hypothetical protein
MPMIDIYATRGTGVMARAKVIAAHDVEVEVVRALDARQILPPSEIKSLYGSITRTPSTGGLRCLNLFVIESNDPVRQSKK